MLAVVYKGIAIPLLWSLLDKRGNSNGKERITLIQRFITLFGRENIQSLLADREFVGTTWFSWLNTEEIKFCIRIKKNSKVCNTQGEMVQIHTLFRDLKPNEVRHHDRMLCIDDVMVHVSALCLKDQELLIVATNDKHIDAIQHYAKRWEIETLFGCLKSRGFNLEDTHLTDQDKISRLLCVYAVAFCWAYYVGILENEKKAITIKKHGRKSKSIFRIGFDMIFDALKQVLFFRNEKPLRRLIQHFDGVEVITSGRR